MATNRFTQWVKIAWFFSCVFGVLYSTTTRAKPLTYTPLSTYFLQHPEQEDLSQQFSHLVRLPAQASATQQQRPLKIFVVYPGKQISDYWRRSIISFTARLDELGILYEIKAHYTRPTMAQEQQERLLQKATRYQADYLIFTLDTEQHSNLISRILSAGMSKLILQNITTPVAEWQHTPPFLYVGFDHAKGSETLSQYFKTKTNNQGEYGVVLWSPGLISDSRGQSFIDSLSRTSNLTMSQRYYTQASRQSAYRSALNILKHSPQIKFIYACATDVAFGVLDALKETGKSKTVLVNGWGGGEQELAAIEQGELAVTVMRMNDDNGVAMAEAIKLDLAGQSKRIPQVYSGDFALVTPDTHPMELAQLKAVAFRYSGIPISVTQ